MIKIKSVSDISGIRDSGAILAETFEILKKEIAPGMTTEEIDDIAREFVFSRKARPAFLNYSGFPKSVCISVNEEVIHGIPGKRMIREGDVVSLDFGVDLKGYITDSAITVAVGKVSPEVRKLIDVTEECLYRGIGKAAAGNRLMDISKAVFIHAKKYDYGVVRDYCGHGVGYKLHEEPNIPNYIFTGANPRLKEGFVLAIEPMITLGGEDVSVLDNEWTVVTDDRSVAAHFEHTVAVHDGYGEILTKLP